ncbi:hypothetical protein PIB30_059616 [Stylosanthes scabra]|uniref:Uncharacterized protein n=1 Tax=Stylosanthes scabra TaxID=79078 RepID=A0ABU6RKX2_9FABA|nr:hypothetical protein [Stylosanthes scabra]
MGVPVGLWSNENFQRITKLWEKMIRQGDRIEESKSYSTTRILLDCFQWEREFGSEVYSVQSHPNLVEGCSASLEEAKLVFVSLGLESPQIELVDYATMGVGNAISLCEVVLPAVAKEVHVDVPWVRNPNLSSLPLLRWE